MTFDIIQHLKEYQWSSSIQDAMIEFIDNILKDDHTKRAGLLELLVIKSDVRE